MKNFPLFLWMIVYGVVHCLAFGDLERAKIGSDLVVFKKMLNLKELKN